VGWLVVRRWLPPWHPPTPPTPAGSNAVAGDWRLSFRASDSQVPTEWAREESW